VNQENITITGQGTTDGDASRLRMSRLRSADKRAASEPLVRSWTGKPEGGTETHELANPITNGALN
jgi:hypothetical protein